MALTRPRGAVIQFDDLNGTHSLRDYPDVKGDGVTDDTAALQAAMDDSVGKILMVPAATYRINTLTVPSNLTMHWEPGVIFSALPTLNVNLSMFTFADTVDSTIVGHGALVTMSGQFTTGEQRHCMDVRGATNIHIEGMQLDGAGGDGMRIAGSLSAGPTFSFNVQVVEVRMTLNRRQGCSVVSAKDCRLVRCELSGTGTGPAGITAPGFGLDIEPNTSADTIQGIEIDAVHTFNNGVAPEGGGITLDLHAFNNSGNFATVFITNHRSTDDFIGFNVVGTDNGTTALQGDIRYSNGSILRSGIYGIAVTGWSSLSPAVVIESPKVMNANETGSLSLQFGAGIFVGRGSGAGGATTIGNTQLINPDVFDSRAVAKMTSAFTLDDFDSGNLREVSVIDPVRVGWADASKTSLDLMIHDGTGNISDNFNKLRGSSDFTYSAEPSNFLATYDNSSATNFRVINLSDLWRANSPEITFQVIAAQTLRVLAGATSSISPGVGIGGFIQSNTRGATLRLRRLSTTLWGIVSESGAWFRQSEGTEADSFVHTGTVAATSLITPVVIPGNTLQGVDSLEMEFIFLYGGVAGSKTIQIKIDTDVLTNFVIAAGGAGNASIRGRITRSGSTYRFEFVMVTNAGQTFANSGTGTLGLGVSRSLDVEATLGDATDSITRLLWHRQLHFNQPE